jgi:hypothetical protein
VGDGDFVRAVSLFLRLTPGVVGFLCSDMNSLIPHSWNVPGVFRSRLGQRAGRQRIMTAEGHLLIVLHKVPQPGTSSRDTAFLWRNPRGDWIATEGVSGLGALHEYFEPWRKLVDQLEDQMQQSPSADNYFLVLQYTTPLLRTIRNTCRTLQDAREACPDRDVLIARDEAGELERAIELLHTDAKNGMEFMIAKQGEEQAQRAHQIVRASHRLNLMMAFFLPLTAMGSVFGMHLSHGLESWHAPWMFWGAMTTALLLGVLLVIVIVFNLDSAASGGRKRALHGAKSD